MAFVEDDKKLIDPSQAQQAQGTAQQTDQTQAQPTSGGGGDVVSGSGSQPTDSSSAQSQSSGQQAGSGGSGGWTNIQAYMDANKNDTGAADNLNKTVGSQFDQDKQAVTDQASQAKSAAKAQADQEGAADSSAADWLKNAGSQYSWGGTQSDDYNKSTGQVKDALNAQYTAPSSYNFGLSDKSQEYGQTLGNDQAFNQFLGDQYQRQAGAPLSTGGRNLQTQLDASNEALGKTRQDLLSKYAGLGDYRDSQVADANSAAQQAQQDFTNHKTNLQNFLGNQQSSDLNEINNAQMAAKQAYNADQQGLSGQGGLSGWGTAGYNPNMSWGQLQDQLKPYDAMTPDKMQTPGGFDGSLYNQQQILNNWQGAEDKKYANTGEAQRREWNAIQDMLGSTAPRQNQNFNVRG